MKPPLLFHRGEPLEFVPLVSTREQELELWEFHTMLLREEARILAAFGIPKEYLTKKGQ